MWEFKQIFDRKNDKLTGEHVVRVLITQGEQEECHYFFYRSRNNADKNINDDITKFINLLNTPRQPSEEEEVMEVVQAKKREGIKLNRIKKCIEKSDEKFVSELSKEDVIAKVIEEKISVSEIQTEIDKLPPADEVIKI